MKISGIYKIINKTDNKYYVGSSKNLNNRRHQHFMLLNNNRHPNDHLQHAWNKYGGIKTFEFIIIENVSPDFIKIKEQIYLDIAKTEQDNCYNLNFSANGGELSEYSKQKIRENKLKYWKNIQRRKTQSKKLKLVTSDPSIRTERSNRAKKYFSIEENRKRLSDLKKHYHSIPENKEKWKNQNAGLNNPQSDKKKYNFFNRVTGNKEYCTRYELRMNPKYQHQNLSQSGIAQLSLGKFKSYKNWIIKD